MPSLTATPAQLVMTGGEASFIPYRFSATGAVLRITGGTATIGPGTGASLSVTTPTLDRLTRFDTLLEGEGPSTRLQLIWQQTMEAIEDAFAALTTQVNDNTTLLAQIQTALNLASAANDNANAVTAMVNIADSYPNPPGVLTASNAGTITIAAHDRVYADGTTVDVDSGSIGGFANGASVSVYYVDAARAGGAVTYQGSASPVAQAGNTHLVGVVTIPAVGEVDAQGSGVPAPGYISDAQAAAYERYSLI